MNRLSPDDGHRGQAFPQARPSARLRDEDIFMQEHGGPGCRFVYRLACPGRLLEDLRQGWARFINRLERNRPRKSPPRKP